MDGLVSCVLDRGMRQLVVVGRAGVGKTSVAAAVAGRLPHPAASVSLDGAADHQEVLVRVARAIGVAASGARLRSGIVARLATDPSVLVLDDCDDWAAVGPVVDDLLPRCPRLVVLHTARSSPPDADPATVVHLRPLPVPPAYEPSDAAVSESPAVQLFLQRAQQSNPAFRPSADDVETIAEMCRRLDGLPLAIALAASRISLMQPDAMLREMRRVGEWELVGLSLEDELERSTAELGEASRRVMAALGVFSGGASVDALHAVSGLPELADTITALADLVDRDLVALDRARARYSLGSAAAAFVGDRRLLDEHAVEELRRRHADHFSSTARVHGDDDLAIDHGNRLAAVRWLRDAGDHDRVLRLVVDTAADFDRRGEPNDGRLLLTSALANASGADPRTEAEAHLWVARFVAESPEPVDRRLAVDHLMAARSLAERSGHESTLLAALLTICENHTLVGSFDLANEAISDGLARSGGGRHPAAEVGFLTWKAVVTHQRGDARGAAEVVAEAIRKAVALGDTRLIVRSCLVFLGLPSEVRAEVVTDSPPAKELAEMARADGDLRGEGWILALVTGNALDDGDVARAAAAGRDLLAHAVERANAPLGRLALAATVRLAATTGREREAAVLIGALDRHEPAIEASMAPHTYAAYRAAAAEVAAALGADHHVLHERGATAEWDELTAAADALLVGVVEGSPAPSDRESSPAEALTPRELEVLSELVAGRSNKEIASALGLRPKTVMHHCASIYRKLGVSGRAGAVGAAMRSGLLPG